MSLERRGIDSDKASLTLHFVLSLIGRGYIDMLISVDCEVVIVIVVFVSICLKYLPFF